MIIALARPVTNEKINPKIQEISGKAQKVKELQKEINSRLEKLENLEVQGFIMNKKKRTINESKVIAENGKVKTILSEEALKNGFMDLEEARKNS